MFSALAHVPATNQPGIRITSCDELDSTRPKGSVASGIIYHSMAAFMNGSCPESSGKGETGSNVTEQSGRLSTDIC